MIVVSIGLIKARIPNALKIAGDLLSGTMKPDKIIFYVSREPHLYDAGIQPWELSRDNNERIEFRWVENDGPPRRVVNPVQEFWDLPDTKIIIFDDDRKPGSDTIQKLVEYSNSHPNEALSVAGNIHNYTDKKSLQDQGVIFDHLSWYDPNKSIGIALGWQIKKPIEVDTLSPGVGMLIKPKFFDKDFLNWKTVYDKDYGINQSDQAFISYSLRKNNIKKVVIQSNYVPEYPEYTKDYYQTFYKEHPKIKLRKYYRTKQINDWIINTNNTVQNNTEAIRYFNRWRNEYDRYSFAKQKQIYNALEVKYPDQQKFTTEEISNFLKDIKNLKILEIGGWKGELASKILSQNENIISWDNYEICSNAVEKTVCTDKRYKPILLKDFPWNLNIFGNYNVCILSHVIEHIKENQLKLFFDKIYRCNYIYIEAPIKENRKDVNWNNYGGTHILECGWNDIDKMLSNYIGAKINDNIKTYKRLYPQKGVTYAYDVMNIVKLRGEKWVRDSFNSLKGQSDDIIVIDYCSTDNIKALAKEYGFRYFNIEKTPDQYYHTTKMKNKSIIEAKYDLYFGVTPDIIYHKDTTKTILDFYGKHDMNKECLILQAKKDNTEFRSPMMVHNRNLLLKARGVDERITFYGNEHSYINNISLQIFKLTPTYIYEPLNLWHRPHKREYVGIGINDQKQVDCRMFSNDRIRLLSANFEQEVKDVVNSYW